jgi:hypothetical protein
MTKLMLVMMELIIIVILKVHANDPTTPSSAPAHNTSNNTNRPSSLPT